MAFVELEFYSLAAVAPPSAEAGGPVVRGFGRRESRVLAIAASLAIHSAILWLYVTRLDDASHIMGTSGSSGGALTIIDLAPSAYIATAVPADARDIKQSEVAAAEPDLSQSTSVPIEWSVTSIKTARSDIAAQSESVVKSPVASTVGTTPGGTAGGMRGSGGSGYDPYAGAAPMRDNQYAASSPAALQLRASDTWLDEVRDAIRRKFPRARGVLNATVRVNASGLITEVVSVEGDVKELNLDLVRPLLLGRKIDVPMGTGAAGTLVRVPAIRIKAS